MIGTDPVKLLKRIPKPHQAGLFESAAENDPYEEPNPAAINGEPVTILHARSPGEASAVVFDRHPQITGAQTPELVRETKALLKGRTPLWILPTEPNTTLQALVAKGSYPHDIKATQVYAGQNVLRPERHPTASKRYSDFGLHLAGDARIALPTHVKLSPFERGLRGRIAYHFPHGAFTDELLVEPTMRTITRVGHQRWVENYDPKTIREIVEWRGLHRQNDDLGTIVEIEGSRPRAMIREIYAENERSA